MRFTGVPEPSFAPATITFNSPFMRFLKLEASRPPLMSFQFSLHEIQPPCKKGRNRNHDFQFSLHEIHKAMTEEELRAWWSFNSPFMRFINKMMEAIEER